MCLPNLYYPLITFPIDGQARLMVGIKPKLFKLMWSQKAMFQSRARGCVCVCVYVLFIYTYIYTHIYIYLCVYQSLSHIQLFVTPWAIIHQTPLSMEFSKKEYWSGLPFPSPGDHPNSGIEPGSPALQADSLHSELPGKMPT